MIGLTNYPLAMPNKTSNFKRDSKNYTKLERVRIKAMIQEMGIIGLLQ